MKSLRIALVVATVLAVSGAERLPTISPQPTAAARALAQARAAISPDRDPQAIRALAAKGRRLARNQWFGPGNRAPEFSDRTIELQILFPDHFLRIMERMDGRLGTTGFRKRTALDGQPAPEYERLFVGRLVLGVLLRTETTFRVTLDRASTSSVLVFTGPDDFRTEILLDQATSLPATLRHKSRTNDGSLIDVEWLLEDHKRVSGVTLPHRITRTARGVRSDTHVFESWTVDPPLKPEDFAVKR